MGAIDNKGFWRNKRGEYVHPEMVLVDKQLEDEVVRKLTYEAETMHLLLKNFKIAAFAECYAFVDLLRQEYNMDRMKASKQGSITLKTFDGTMKVQIQVAKLITFDQKLTLAKEKIDEYLAEKTAHADAEIQTLITRAFDVKNGKVDVKQIIGLKQYPIRHPKWLAAMKMIDDATEIAGTKSYIRFKKRDGGRIDAQLSTIVLDFASVVVSEDDIKAFQGVREVQK